MSEIITAYEIRDPKIPMPMNRDEFYKEQTKAYDKIGKTTKMVEIIGLLLFNTNGQIILQKRSADKGHNPGLIDKSIGGHIKFDDSPFYTLMVETVQELRIPSIVLYTEEDFKKTFQLLKSYLDHIAIVRLLGQGDYILNRNIKGKNYKMHHRVHLFIGVYNGATKPVDKEASGTLYYDLPALKQEIKKRPDNFTDDLKMYLKKFEPEIKTFIGHLK